MMSTPAAVPAETPTDEPQLSKAELRRRRILAKRGARMALVTGDKTLAENPAESAPAAFAPAPHVQTPGSAPRSEPIPVRSHAPPLEPRGQEPAPNFEAVPRRGGTTLALPRTARVALVTLSGLAVPIIRARVAARASALQLFLAVEAVALAPQLAAWATTRRHGGGVMAVLSALVGVSRTMGDLARDLSTFMFALFVSLRLIAQLI